MKIDLAIADTMAQKRDLDELVARRKGKQRAEFPFLHRTHELMLATFTTTAVCRSAFHIPACLLWLTLMAGCRETQDGRRCGGCHRRSISALQCSTRQS